MFGLHYSSPLTLDALIETVTETWHQGGVKLVELKVSSTDGAEILRELVAQGGAS